MDIDHSSARLLRTQDHTVVLRNPVRRTAHRILGNHSEVARLHQIFEGLWRRLLVERVVIDRLAHGLQVLLHRTFPPPPNPLLIPPPPLPPPPPHISFT